MSWTPLWSGLESQTHCCISGTPRKQQFTVSASVTLYVHTKLLLLLLLLNRFSRVQLFAILWTTAHQAPLSMGFSRQEHWSGLPFPPPGDLLNLGMEPMSMSPSLAGGVSSPRAPPVTLVKSLHFLGGQFLYLRSEEFLAVKWFRTKNVQQNHLKIFKNCSYRDPLPNQLNHIWVEALKCGIKKLFLRQLEFKPVY